jgi:hypothetical protein
MEPNPPPVPGTAKNSRLAIWSLVLGILGLVFLIICIGPVLFSIPAVICGHLALGRIKRSAGALGGHGLALGGLITGYAAIALIPLLVIIAIPNFTKAREVAFKNQCLINLHRIDGAKQQWALENKKDSEAAPTAQDIDKYLPDGKTFESLHCPKDGTYTIGKVGEAPTCSVPEHQLP